MSAGGTACRRRTRRAGRGCRRCGWSPGRTSRGSSSAGGSSRGARPRSRPRRRPATATPPRDRERPPTPPPAPGGRDHLRDRRLVDGSISSGLVQVGDQGRIGRHTVSPGHVQDLGLAEPTHLLQHQGRAVRHVRSGPAQPRPRASPPRERLDLVVPRPAAPTRRPGAGPSGSPGPGTRGRRGRPTRRARPRRRGTGTGSRRRRGAQPRAGRRARPGSAPEASSALRRTT